jgi:ATP-binding cassette, subfamily B, bacterial
MAARRAGPGVTGTVAAGPATGRQRTRRERLAVIASRLGPYARPHRRRLRVALGASVLVTLAQLAVPWPLSWLVDLAAPPSSSRSAPPSWLPTSGDPAIWMMACLVVVGAVLGASEYLQRVSVARYVVRSINDARVGVLTGTLSASTKREPGDIVTRVVTDTARIRIGMKGALVHILQHGLFLVGVSVVMLALDVMLGLAYLTGLAVAFGIAAVGADRTATLSRRRRGRESRVVDEALRVATTAGEEAQVKAADRERPVAIISQVKGRTAVVVQVVLALTACLVLTLAVRFSASGRLGTGDLAVVASYLLMLHYPMMRMGRQITRLGPQLTSAERLARLARPGTGR